MCMHYILNNKVKECYGNTSLGCLMAVNIIKKKVLVTNPTVAYENLDILILNETKFY